MWNMNIINILRNKFNNICLRCSGFRAIAGIVILVTIIAGNPHGVEAKSLKLDKLSLGAPQAQMFSPDRYAITTVKHYVTAYSSEVGQTDSTPFETAILSQVRKGVVAANWLPIGTMVRFPDYDPDSWYVVEDRMNERYTDRTDIWMNSTTDARKFGIRYMNIEVALPVK